MPSIRHAVIMAAGRGLRMMPLTDTIPKPMAPYNGSTLIARGISRLAERISHIHVTVGYKGAMLAQHVIEHGACSVFNTDGQSNCWWIYHTLLRSLDEPVYVLTCDNVVDLDFHLLEENYHALNEPACMLVPVRPIPGLEGDYVFHQNHVVTEISRLKKAEIYCSGIQILNPRRLNLITRDAENFYDVWQQLIVRKQLMLSSVYPKKWFAVDTVEQLRSLNNSPI
ncbi:MAG TPA: sugar phosphate nucleotidyltransferase [Pyrinomonadaceae bacterium]|jgi:NDP-sugar pyrophosphorylase family protein|nr:sugar phosphate nucleotidyltransferase [Pyrinomonadaceae bacterium]